METLTKKMFGYCKTFQPHSPHLKKVNIFCAALLLIMLFPTLSYSDTTTAPPIKIKSKEAQYQQDTGEAKYFGNVIAKQTDKTLNSDELYLQKTGDKFDKFIAIGKTKRAKVLDFKAANDTTGIGKANTIIYYLDENKAELIGNAELTQDGYTVTGEKLVYFFDNKKLISTPSPSTRVTFVMADEKPKATHE